MLSLPSPSPAFPPVSDVVARLRSLPWGRIGSFLLTAVLTVAAFVYVTASLAWQNRGRLAPILRRLAAWLQTLADSLPAEPLTAESPRALFISRLETMGENVKTLRKLSTVRLVSLAQRRGLC